MTDSDTIADATTANFLGQIQQARQEDVDQLLARIPADHRAGAAVWLDTHGILPPWYEDMLQPERAWEPGS